MHKVADQFLAIQIKDLQALEEGQKLLDVLKEVKAKLTDMNFMRKRLIMNLQEEQGLGGQE